MVPVGCMMFVQFNSLMDVLQGMLRQIDHQHRLKMISELPDNSALEQRQVT